MKNPAAATLKSCIAQWSKSDKCRNEGKLAGYFEVVNYFLAAYVMYNDIGELNAGILCFTQTSNMTELKYTEDIQNGVAHCDHVYDEYFLTVIFNALLHRSVRHAIHSYWSPKQSSTVQDAVRYTTSIARLQYESYSFDTSHTTNKWNHPLGNTNDRMDL